MEWMKKSSSQGLEKGNQNGISHSQSRAKLDNLISETDVAGNELAVAPSKLEVIRLKTLKFMASSWFGQIYVNFFLIVSIFSCGQYIYQTYLTEDQRHLRQILTYVEIILAILFLFDWCLSLFLAEQRWDHFFSFFAMVDFATIVPTALANLFFREAIEYYDIENFADWVNYLVHGAYTLRILRALRLHRKLVYIADEIDRFLYSMLLSVVTMVLFDSAVMQYLEGHIQDLSFHSWMYYTVVTICTIGYGDISPLSTLGRFAAMFLILFAIIFVPQQSNQLIEKMSILSVYARKHYKPLGNAKHVVICGEMKSTFLEEFFRELFHEDHENLNLNALVLQPDLPSTEIHEILRDPLFNIVVHYFQGSPLNNHDLARVHVGSAVAVFIMGNKFSIKPDEDDAKTILQYFSIRKYLQCLSTHSDPFYCLQLIRPDNKRHLGLTNEDESKEIVICLNEMKMGLLAKTCMFPGTSTFIFNLLTSFADTGDEENEENGENENEENGENEMSPNERGGGGGSGGGGRGRKGSKNSPEKNQKGDIKKKKKRSRDAVIHPEEGKKLTETNNLTKKSQSGLGKSNGTGGPNGGGGSGGGGGGPRGRSSSHPNERNEEKKVQSKESSDDSDDDENDNKEEKSSGEEEEEEEGSEEDEFDPDESDSDSEQSDNPDDDDVNLTWKKEYLQGCQWEIYTTDMAEVFCGVRFIDIARRLYNKLGVVLFALRVTDLHSTRNRVRVVLNPVDFIIPTKKRFKVQGFVIAQNQASSDLSFVGTGGSEVHGLEGLTQSIQRNIQSIHQSQSPVNRTFTPVNQIDQTPPPSSTTTTSDSSFTPAAPLHRKGSINSISTRNLNDGNLIQSTFSGGWQTLLASQHEAEKLNESQNTRQERIQKMEDEFIKNNFFIKETPSDITEVTIQTSLPEEYPYIKDHMIIIAKGLSNLYDFIRPLRAKYLGKLRHIVILFPHELPVDIWRRISIFEGILYVRGSSLEEADLIRAGIFRVSQVVVLADPDSTTSTTSSSSNMDALVDADAIFTYHSVKRLNEKAHIVIEVVRQQNVGYLDTHSTEMDYKLTPNFAAGTLFTSSMLDAVVCQTFYNPQIIRVLNKLISGTDHAPDKNGIQLMKASQQQQQQQSNSRNGLKTLYGSSLYQIPIPDGFAGKTYGQLFNHFANEGGLCIGLLRGTWSQLTFGPNSNRMPYVFTNPSSSTVLYKCDKVFILSQQILTCYKITVKEVMEAFRMANHAAAKKKKKALNDVHGTLKSELVDISSAQKSLERSLSSLTVDLVKRFDDMIQLQNNLNFLQTLPGKDYSNSSISSTTSTSVSTPGQGGGGQGHGQGFGGVGAGVGTVGGGGGGGGGGGRGSTVTPPPPSIERSISRSRITEEIQRRLLLKKSNSNGSGLDQTTTR